MTKREFIMQYALNRALGNRGGLDGATAVREGLKAWEELERLTPKPTFPPMSKPPHGI